jgi:hypothetical protein
MMGKDARVVALESVGHEDELQHTLNKKVIRL